MMKRTLKMVCVLTVLATLVLACVPNAAMAYTSQSYYGGCGYYNPWTWGFDFSTPTYTCTLCNGSGQFEQRHGGGNYQYTTDICPLCHGRGYR